MIAFHNVGKQFGASIALAKFSHRFERGKVHALMGKNGSGKSTLVKIIGGVISADTGEMRIAGQVRHFNNPADAQAAGIMTVHQELSLQQELCITENILLGRLPLKQCCGLNLVDWAAAHRQARLLLQEMGLDLDPQRRIASLSVGQQQMVEIVKAMAGNPSVLLLDEPTSALATQEVAQLFALVRRLRSKGVTIIYITHRMNELFEIADTCTVLRDGRFIGAIAMSDTTPKDIVEMMFGQVARAVRPPRAAAPHAQPILRVSNLTRAPAFSDVSFELRRGEVLGLAGLLGSGRTEILRAIFGADPVEQGQIELAGETVKHATPRRMRDRGLGYTSENRKEEGLVQDLSIHDNLMLASLDRLAQHGMITRKIETPFVRALIERLQIKVSSPLLPVSSLSGGNQQKVVVGNWLNTAPKVMLLDEPSRGIDIQAKQQIFKLIWEQAEQGLSTIFVSSELEEVLEVCDRVLVIRQGRIVAQRQPETTSLAELYELCMQGNPHEL